MSIVTTPATFNADGSLVQTAAPSSYCNEDDIPVQRLAYRRIPLARRLRICRGTYKALAGTHPNIVFIHGPQFVDAIAVALYLRRHPHVRAYVDSHADFGNSAQGPVSRWLLHGVLWRATAKLLARYVEKFYGVLPVRVDFLHDVYGIPRNKINLLLMGADDQLVAESRARSANEIRAEFDLPQDVLLVATGGKVNQSRPEVLELLETVQSGEAPYEVVIFGNASAPYQSRYQELCQSDRVHNLGWLTAEQSLDIMAAADVVAFPGKHSVLWEQAVAVGAPLLVRSLPGAKHVDLGGNCRFLLRADAAEMREALNELASQPEALAEMKRRAESPGRKEFLYGHIATASLR